MSGVPMSVSGTNHPQDVPKEEEGILNYLLEVRSFLSKLKKNRTQYLNSKDVLNTYQEVLTRVRELDGIRKSSTDVTRRPTCATTLIHDTDMHNRVDSVLDDVFQLLSLCFLTVGLKTLHQLPTHLYPLSNVCWSIFASQMSSPTMI